MTTRRTSAFALAAAVGLQLFALPSDAAVTETASRLMRAGATERYEVRTPLSDVNAGAARVSINAPFEAVSRVVQDFGNYEQAITKFEKVRVVGRRGDQTDVYLEVPILKGSAKVWAILRFEPLRTLGADEVELHARMIKGNVKQLDARWIVRRIDATHTQLDLELLIVPKLPLPNSYVSRQASKAAKQAVGSLRTHSEKMEKTARTG